MVRRQPLLRATLVLSRMRFIHGRRSTIRDEQQIVEGTPIAPATLPALSVKRRLSPNLRRALGIDCPSCRGLGCTVCADTGVA